MDAVIADWVLYLPRKSRNEFVTDICVLGLPHLLKYVDFAYHLNESNSFDPANISSFIYPKNIAMLHLVSGIDYARDTMRLTYSGVRKILTPKTLEYLKDVDALNAEYDAYVASLEAIRMDV